MNGNYYHNPIFPEHGINNDEIVKSYPDIQNYDRSTLNVPFLTDQSYMQNILKMNIGKVVTVYVTVPGSKEWQDKTFKGVIEEASKDHLIVSEPNTGNWHLISTMYIIFISFEEPIKFVKQYS